MEYTTEQVSDAMNQLAAWNDEIGHVRLDILDVMSRNPDSVTAVLSALEEGRIEGMSYYGECACLLGTIAASKPEFSEFEESNEAEIGSPRQSDWIKSVGLLTGRIPDETTPAEEFFLNIASGHTPATSPYSLLAYAWISDWAQKEGIL